MKFFLLITGLFFGCAKPTYVSAPGPSPGQEDKADVTPSCELQFQASKICLTWKWMKVPDDHTAGTMLVKLWRPNAADLSPVMVDVPGVWAYLQMATMPHGSQPVVITQKDIGTYAIANVFFSMHGPWYIYVELKDAAGNVLEKLQIDYRF